MLSRDPVVSLCSAALAAAAVWACLVALSVVRELWRARAEGRRARLGRVVLACCGLAIAAPAPAALGDGTGLGGLPMPDRAVGPAHRAVAQQIEQPRTVVVATGDCLWHLAAAGLPPDAGPAEIAARWRAIYRLNRALIGADPDVIQPGQRLVLPH